jgi:hypothetical protein
MQKLYDSTGSKKRIVVRSESGVRCRIVYSTENQVFVAEFVLFVVNQVFALELCILQRIRCSLSNCVFRSESGVRCWIVLSVENQVFPAEFMLSAVNQVFAAELCCPQRIRCLQRIRCSLSNLCYPQRIRCLLPNCVDRRESGVRCWICVVRSESGFRCRILLSTANQVFATKFVLFAANQVFAVEFYCPQRIRCSLLNLCCL